MISFFFETTPGPPHLRFVRRLLNIRTLSSILLHLKRPKIGAKMRAKRAKMKKITTFRKQVMLKNREKNMIFLEIELYLRQNVAQKLGTF